MRSRERQRGVGATLVIILLAILAVVGASFALIATSQQISSARSLTLSRAYYAARAGVEEAISRARNESECETLDGTPKSVNGITVELSCSASDPIREGGRDYVVFTVAAQATEGSKPSGTLVRRRLTLKATDF
jgi:MSHA biogenesis protein MshP